MGYGPVRNGKHTPVTLLLRCAHGLGLNCLKCYPTQYGKTNARMP